MTSSAISPAAYIMAHQHALQLHKMSELTTAEQNALQLYGKFKAQGMTFLQATEHVSAVTGMSLGSIRRLITAFG